MSRRLAKMHVRMPRQSSRIWKGLKAASACMGPSAAFALDTEDADVRAVVHKRLDQALDLSGWIDAHADCAAQPGQGVAP